MVRWAGRCRWTPPNRPGASARRQPGQGHRGLDRVTRIPIVRTRSIPSRLTMDRPHKRRCDLQDPPQRPTQGTAAGPAAHRRQTPSDTTYIHHVQETISVRDGRPGRPRSRNRSGARGQGLQPPLRTVGSSPTAASRSPSPNARTRRPAGPTRLSRRPARTFDADAYKGRNVVERCFNRLKQWRGIATRFDKTARSYLAGLTFAAG